LLGRGVLRQAREKRIALGDTMMGISMGDEACGFLTLTEMAHFLRLHRLTLYKLVWRKSKSVPPFVKTGFNRNCKNKRRQHES